MKIVGRCEISQVIHEVSRLEKRYQNLPSVKFTGKQGDHLEIKLKTKFSSLEKIGLFFQYIGLSVITLGGTVGESWRNSYRETKDQWLKGRRVEVLEVDANDELAKKVVSLWNQLYNQKNPVCTEWRDLFHPFQDLPANDVNRLADSILLIVQAGKITGNDIKQILEHVGKVPVESRAQLVNLYSRKDFESIKWKYWFPAFQDLPVNEAKRLADLAGALFFSLPTDSPKELSGYWYELSHKEIILFQLSQVPPKERMSFADLTFPLIREIKESSRFRSCLNYMLNTLRNVPSQEIESVAKLTLPLLSSAPDRGHDIIDSIRSTPKEERADIASLTLSIVQAGKLADYDVVGMLEYIRRVPEGSRAKFVDFFLKLYEIPTEVYLKYYIENLSKNYKYPEAEEITDSIMNALNTIDDSQKVEFVKKAMDLVANALIYGIKKPDQKPDLSDFKWRFEDIVKDAREITTQV